MIVVVVGMHSSGASTVAGLLHRHGIVMGEDEMFFPGQLNETPTGLFENPRFRILNDRIVERQGYSVRTWKPEIPACRPGAITRLRMRRLLRNCEERHSLWGFKDPRNCLTLDCWLREIERVGVLDRTKIVYTVRDPDAVARSLVNRNGIDVSTALRLWKVYNERAIASIDTWLLPTHYLTYEDLCDDPERTTLALLRFTGVPTPVGGRQGAAAAPSARTANRRKVEGEGVALSDAVAEINNRILSRVRGPQGR